MMHPCKISQNDLYLLRKASIFSENYKESSSTKFDQIMWASDPQTKSNLQVWKSMRLSEGKWKSETIEKFGVIQLALGKYLIPTS
ncbi:unnamed protein product [Paramecium octaurelia]|uniref:Uncharacterized protein n=1 Tax=Paramecium octaurelia TaxID=43137 RepID=A0A8S1XK69_PAROT|nr:unnamed protein product [Paramecium octaurelia]